MLQRRVNVEKEVHGLRNQISKLKVTISTTTKGFAMSKFEVREDRLGDTASSHTKQNENKSESLMEEESFPERREKVLGMMEDQFPEQSASPHRILSAQQRNAQEILLA